MVQLIVPSEKEQNKIQTKLITMANELYFKTMYAGKETKRVKNIRKAIQKTKQFSKIDMIQMMLE